MDFFIHIRDFIYYKRYYFIFGLILCVLLVLYFLNNNDDNNYVVQSADDSLEEKKEEVINSENVTIVVDIKGCVLKPGIYYFESEERIGEVLKEAKILDECNTDSINLSEKIKDEMVIYVPFKEEEKNNDVYVNNNDKNYSNTSSATSKKENDGKVSINTADESELMTLNGIGSSKAKAIIEYRNKNGKFNDISEILNINGLGQAIYEKIKDNIKL